MNKSEFWLLAATNGQLLLFSFFGIWALHIFFYRKFIFSIYDPLFFHQLMAAGATTVVFILWWNSTIDNYYAYNFILTQTALYLGFQATRPYWPSASSLTNQASVVAYKAKHHYIFMVSLFMYLLAQAVVFYTRGIPLFMESRLDVYTGGSGFGFFGRIIDVTELIIVTLALFRIVLCDKRMRSLSYIALVLVINNSILSGSKSKILIIIFILAYLGIFFGNDEKTKKRVNHLAFAFGILSVAVAVIVVAYQTRTANVGDGILTPLIVIVMRIINNGDIYMAAYPNGFLENATKDNGVIALFSGILGMLRLYDWNFLPDSIGLQLHQLLFNNDLIEGPNTRHNVFGLFYFGFFGSIFFSFIIGLAMGFTRNRLPGILSKSLTGLIIYVLLAHNVLIFEIDPVMAINNFASILVIGFPIIYLAEVLSFASISRRSRHC